MVWIAGDKKATNFIAFEKRRELPGHDATRVVTRDLKKPIT